MKKSAQAAMDVDFGDEPEIAAEQPQVNYNALEENAELYLVASAFLNPGHVLGECRTAGITAQSFQSPTLSEVYARMASIWDRTGSVDVAAVLEELSPKNLREVGGMAGLLQMSQLVPTTLSASSLINTLRLADQRREVYRLTSRLAEQMQAGGDPVDALRELAAFRQRAEFVRPASIARPITAFTYPTSDDPNILLGSDDYLGRGGGLLFVSHAGAGKSSWIMDACMSWALGRPWMGLKCGGKPRKSLIIQAEDSDRYVGRIFASYAHVHNLSNEERETMARHCVIVRLKGIAGEAFFAELKRLTDLHQPDFVVVNPIYLYAEGDIARSEYAQPFLLGLDRVNAQEKWAYILIHHTGKPQAKGTNGKRAETDDWESAYMGFGSSYLVNWPRCSILLEPLAGVNGRFTIRLGKGGYNAGVTRAVPQGAGVRHEVVTRIGIRHSRQKMTVGGMERPVYYWEPDDEPEVVEKSARPEKYSFDDWKTLFPPRSSEGWVINQLHRAISPNGVIPIKAFPDVLKRWSADGLVETIKVQGQPTRFRLAV